MRYLVITQEDMARHPNLVNLLWDRSGWGQESFEMCSYYAPEDHPNIGLLLCYFEQPVWQETHLASTGQVRLFL